MPQVGLCKKDKEGRKVHEYVKIVDGFGREFMVCNKCSNVSMNIKRQRIFNDETN